MHFNYIQSTLCGWRVATVGKDYPATAHDPMIMASGL